jgi:hypothetical protein
MENNNKIRELYSIYLEIGHEVFDEKIKNLWSFIYMLIAMLLV